MKGYVTTMTKCAALAALAIFALWPAVSTAAVPVSNLTLAHSGEFTEVVIPVASHLLCEHFTEPAKDDRPFRIVLNICGAEHALPQQNFSTLPACMVQKIRTSQFSGGDQPVVRVVLDLKSSATYTVRTEKDRLVVAIADPEAAPFAAWDANPNATMAMTSTPSQPTATVAPVEPKSQSTTVAKAEPSQPKPVTTSPAKPAPVSKPAPTVATNEAATNPVINTPKSAPDEMTAAAPSTVPQGAPRVDEPVMVEAPVRDMNETPNTSNPMPAVAMNEAVQPMSVGNQMPVTAAAPTFVLPAQPLVVAPEYLEAGDVTMPQTQTSEMTPSAGVATSEDMDANASQPTTTPVQQAEPPIWASVPPVVGSEGVTAIDNNDTTAPAANSQEALIDRLKAKFFSNQRAPRPFMTEEGMIVEQLKTLDSSNQVGPPTPGSNIDREALLARLRQASRHDDTATLPANILPSLPGGPVRTEVFYDDQGRRDPFEPLLKGLRSGFFSDALPSVENLRMVGVLKDNDRALALLEDTDGHSYIMKPGDPVANGRIVSVGEQRTIIQVDEYGWTRTVALQLSARGADPSKALGMGSLNLSQPTEETQTPPQEHVE